MQVRVDETRNEKAPLGVDDSRAVAAGVFDGTDGRDAPFLDRNVLRAHVSCVDVYDAAVNDHRIGRFISHRHVDERGARGTVDSRTSTTISISTGMLPGGRRADRCARVDAAVAENVVEQLRGAVDDG